MAIKISTAICCGLLAVWGFLRWGNKLFSSLIKKDNEGTRVSARFYADYWVDEKTVCRTVRRLAKEHNYVFVGRCTDYILREDPACFNIFVHAPKDFRIWRLCQSLSVSEDEAREMIEKNDKARSSSYNFYTDKELGKASSYHSALIPPC